MFDPSTKPKILSILAIELNQVNANQIGTLLTDIAAIDGGSLIAPIESLIAQIESTQLLIDSPASLKLSGMIQAKTVKWQPNGGAGLGAMQSLNRLKNQLRDLLGLANPNSGSTVMVRKDRYSRTGLGGNYSDWRLLAW